MIEQQARRESACSGSGRRGQDGFSETESEQQRVCIDGKSFWTEVPLKKNTTEKTEKHLNKEEEKPWQEASCCTSFEGISHIISIQRDYRTRLPVNMMVESGKHSLYNYKNLPVNTLNRMRPVIKTSRVSVGCACGSTNTEC